jgi:hypothetical protein
METGPGKTIIDVNKDDEKGADTKNAAIHT